MGYVTRQESDRSRERVGGGNVGLDLSAVLFFVLISDCHSVIANYTHIALAGKLTNLAVGLHWRILKFRPALFVYDTLLTLSQEVDHIWHQRFSVPSVLYVVNRYCELTQKVLIIVELFPFTKISVRVSSFAYTSGSVLTSFWIQRFARPVL